MFVLPSSDMKVFLIGWCQTRAIVSRLDPAFIGYCCVFTNPQCIK